MTEVDNWKSFKEKLEEYIENYNNKKSRKDVATTINVSIGDIIGRDSEAKSMWDCMMLKRHKSTHCNLIFEGTCS
jgi:hypothetical protein